MWNNLTAFNVSSFTKNTEIREIIWNFNLVNRALALQNDLTRNFIIFIRE